MTDDAEYVAGKERTHVRDLDVAMHEAVLTQGICSAECARLGRRNARAQPRVKSVPLQRDLLASREEFQNPFKHKEPED
jgi:hypothetical protein